MPEADEFDVESCDAYLQAEVLLPRGDNPAFAWWVKEALKCHDRIISAAKSRYWKRTHKFGIWIPKMIEEALQIDQETGTDFWHLAIEKEMKNVMPAFKILDDDGKAPIGYKWIPCHIILM